MDDLQRISVDDHIGELMRDGERLRAERVARDSHTPHTGPAVAGGRAGDHPPARVRLGRWLIDLGSAVAGTSQDRSGGAAGRAA